MKNFSLLSKLAAEQPKPKIVEAVAPTPATVQYRVYVLEGLGEDRKVCIPVDNVDSFDAFVNENPEMISDIDLMVEKFSAVVIS